MVFSSLLFLFSFLPFILIGNFIWRNRTWQNLLLFVGSLYFYAWGERERVFLMIGSILINYVVGIKIEKNQSINKQKLILAIGIIVNLGVLVYFKYAEFFVESLNSILQWLGISQIGKMKYEKLPIGISFYTFQSISYLVDVYRKEVKAQRNFIDLGVYIALFPQLIAGPIVRYQEIASQLRGRVHSMAKFSVGIKRFIIGLAKKMLLANPIAYLVDEIYLIPPNELSFSLAWLAVFAYALQIYFDFSAYCDMAIGLGKMFGFTFPENFNFPYAARSIRDFWRRWHITLSVWFRDYLYIPLGGSRGNNFKLYRNLIVVFLVTGLWHGASWSFIIWGLLHGVFILFERVGFAKVLDRMPRVLQTVYTLLVVLFAWVLFRIENIGDVLGLYKVMFGFSETSTFYELAMFLNPYLIALLVIAGVLCFPIYSYLKIDKLLKNQNGIKNFIYLGLFVFSILEIINGAYNPFIYFRF